MKSSISSRVDAVAEGRGIVGGEVVHHLFDLVFGQRGGAQQREQRHPVRAGHTLGVAGPQPLQDRLKQRLAGHNAESRACEGRAPRKVFTVSRSFTARSRGTGPDSAPIFFSVDEDIDVDIWNSVAVEWFRGINSVLGADRTGSYGHSGACTWAIEDGVIGRSTTAGHRWAWQTKSWSHGQREPTAVLYQEVVNSPESPSTLLGGIRVDEDEVLAADFGQWNFDR